MLSSAGLACDLGTYPVPLGLPKTITVVVTKTHNLKLKQICFIVRAANKYRKGGGEQNGRSRGEKSGETASMGRTGREATTEVPGERKPDC